MNVNEDELMFMVFPYVMSHESKSRQLDISIFTSVAYRQEILEGYNMNATRVSDVHIFQMLIYYLISSFFIVS